MKNILICTTILAASASAAVAKMEVKVGGYYTNGIQITSSDVEANDGRAGSAQDFEFALKGNLEMDNGVTAYVNMEYDASGANTASSRTDDIFGGLKGSFGDYFMGNFDPMKKHGGLVPMPAGVNDTDYPAATGITLFSDGRGTDFVTVGDTDATSAGYISPSISGFKVGARFAMNAEKGQTNTSNNEDDAEMATGYVNYSGKFGDASVSVGGYYSNAMSGSVGSVANSGNVIGTEFGAGAKVGVSGFTISAAYTSAEGDKGDLSERDTMGASLGYKTGPWSLSTGYAVQDGKGSNGTDKNDISQYNLNATYTMGPGVTIFADLTGLEVDNATDSQSGTTVTSGFKIGF